MMQAATQEHTDRVLCMCNRVWALFCEEPESETVFVSVMLNLLATHLKERCPNDSAVQDAKIEEYADIIKLTLIHNKVRKTS